MDADKRPSESENARQLRATLNTLRASRATGAAPSSAPAVPSSVPSPAATTADSSPPEPITPAEVLPQPGRIRTFGAPTHRSPPPLAPKSPPPPPLAQPRDTLLPLEKPVPESSAEEDPVERLRRLIEERRRQNPAPPKRPSGPPRPYAAPPQQAGFMPSPPPAVRPGVQSAPAPQTAPPQPQPLPHPQQQPFVPPRPAGPMPPADGAQPDEDPAARLRRLVDERRQKLATERGLPPPPPLEPRPPFKPKPPQDAQADGKPAAASDANSPAERLRRMLEEHKRNAEADAAGSNATPAAASSADDESPAERLARMLEQRRRSNQLPPAATAPAPQPLPTGLPQPRDHLPPPEARKAQKQKKAPSAPQMPALWQRIEGTGFGRTLKKLGAFYIRVAGVVLWTMLLAVIAWRVFPFVLNGFNLFHAGDWQLLRIRYNAGLTIPWEYILAFGTTGVIWAVGAVLVWLKGKPYVWPVLLVLFQLALLPVALFLALIAGLLMFVMWSARVVRTWRANRI